MEPNIELEFEFDPIFSNWYNSRYSIETKSVTHKRMIYEGWKAKTEYVLQTLADKQYLGTYYSDTEQLERDRAKQEAIDNLIIELA
jgi:hypothetical protein